MRRHYLYCGIPILSLFVRLFKLKMISYRYYLLLTSNKAVPRKMIITDVKRDKRPVDDDASEGAKAAKRRKGGEFIIMLG